MPHPSPGAHEVRIRAQAIGIDRVESMWRNDAYLEPASFRGAGDEAARIVDAIGADVTGIAIGDAVDVSRVYRRGLETDALKPVIDRVGRFDDMVEVHRFLETNGQCGKIVVTV